MAEAYGKLTGRPGVCLVTRGPGATHAAVGVHTAFQDSTPLVLLVGQVASDQEEREAFQEIDYRRMFGPMAKWVAQIDRAGPDPRADGARVLDRMRGQARPRRPRVARGRARGRESTSPTRHASTGIQPSASHEDVAEVERLLANAERPLAILGGGGWTPAASTHMAGFLAANELPAGAAFRRQDTLDNDDPRYVGDVGIGINPKLAQRVRDADLLLVVGPRLGEMTTSGYTLLDVPGPKQTLVHVHPGAEELGRVYQPALPILASPESFAAAVAELRVTPRWRDWAADARADYEAWRRPGPMPGELDLGACIAHLHERVPDAIVTNGAGNHTVWIHRFWRFHSYPTQLAPTSGAMGYGLPAAIAAKAVAPERTVICFSGDGDFLMLGQELATAVQYDLPIVVLVVDNGMYGTIRMHQERQFPGRVVGTGLVNPDFAAYAESFGAHGENITRTDEFPDALERALGAGRPAVIALKIDPEAITPRATLSAVRAGAA